MDSPATENDTTDQLIAACLAGDQQAWQTIVTRYWRRVFNIAYKFVGKHDEAEDLSQEVFLKVYKALGTFDRRANFQTWLVSVTRNLCIDHYRSVRKEREVVDPNIDARTLSPVARGPDAFSRVQRLDGRELLKRGMLALPETLRTAVMLRDIQDCSYHEIATRLGLPEGTVKSRINRGRTELARQIQRIERELAARLEARTRPASATSGAPE